MWFMHRNRNMHIKVKNPTIYIKGSLFACLFIYHMYISSKYSFFCHFSHLCALNSFMKVFTGFFLIWSLLYFTLEYMKTTRCTTFQNNFLKNTYNLGHSNTYKAMLTMLTLLYKWNRLIQVFLLIIQWRLTSEETLKENF